MQHIGKPLQARCFAGLVAMGLTFAVQAQQQEAPASGAENADTGDTSEAATSRLPEKIPDDFYRAELLIIERKMAPDDVNEKMGIHTIDLTPEQEDKLQVITPDGERVTTLQLVPEQDLHLSSAAERLERSGRFNVLAAAGWYQAFPPDHEGATMQVALGDWLASAGHREVEGTITIDRQRYLHVDVRLNHWYQDSTGVSELMGPLPESPGSEGNTEEGEPQAATSSTASDASGTEAGQSNSGSSQADPMALQDAPLAPSADLLTWIRETRRMRSEEVHYLDSPTLGVMVYFSPVEQSEE